MRAITVLLTTLFWAVALAPPAYALDPNKAITQYVHDVWKTRDGLPQNAVTVVMQAYDGYLWCGSEEGLARYDGVRFKIFNKENTGLQSNYIKDLQEDRDKNLWVGSTEGLGLFVNNRFVKLYTTAEGLPHNSISVLFQDLDGNLWIGTRGGLSYKRGQSFTNYTTKEGLPHDIITGITQDRTGAVWIGTEAGLSRFKDGRFTNYSKEDGLTNDLVMTVCVDRAGTIWAGLFNGGLCRFDQGRFVNYTVADGLTNAYVRNIYEDREGTLWIGTYGGGLNRLRDGKFTSYTVKEGLSSNIVLSITEDREGNLWVGTSTGGLNRFRDGKFTTYSEVEGLSNNSAKVIYEDREGTLWIGARGGAISRFKDGRLEVIKISENDKEDSARAIRAFYQDRRGVLWLGTTGNGLKAFKDGEIISYAKKQINYDIVSAIQEDQEGNLWLGTEGGLCRFDNGQWHCYTEQDGVVGSSVKAILAGRDGALWIGTNEGLIRYQNGKFTHYSVKAGLSYRVIFSLYEDDEGVLWIATFGGGLSRFHNGKFTNYRVKDGLFNDAVFQIVEDRLGNLWMSCNKGIFRASKQELNDFAAGRRTSITCYPYGQADGIKEAECRGGTQPAGCRTRDGRIWFPTIEGVVTIDPENILINDQPPPVTIEEVIVNNRPVDTSGVVEIGPGVENLEFRYTALTFLIPERARFKYRLEGYDRDWVDAGARRAAYYTNLAPGRYRFRVIACNDDGIWNIEGAACAFYLQPHFYQTYLFYGLCALLAVAAAAGLYRLRIRQLKARELLLERLVEERTRHLVAARQELQEANQMIEMVFGTVIDDKYRIDALMGQGGMGKIFRATHVKLKKTFAIKLLNITSELQSGTGSSSSNSTQSQLARFEREAEALAKIDHPNVVKITDFGIAHGRVPYIVLEYIKGITLRDLMNRERQLAEGLVINIAKQLCAALSAAHQQGIIHRDLKPENIMIEELDNNELHVRVLDFGIAKLKSDNDENLTIGDELLGTPKYMSPEQLSGDELDARSDIFTICLIIYEMLTGRLPKVYLNDVRPVSEIRPVLSRHLDALLLKGLASAPAQRYATALELRQQLEAVEAQLATATAGSP